MEEFVWVLGLAWLVVTRVVLPNERAHNKVNYGTADIGASLQSHVAEPGGTPVILC